MARGGPRNRSGPQPDPMSGASARKGLSFRTLDAAGYKGQAPKFPLEMLTLREAAVWVDLWTTPQAIAWAAEPWRWRIIAMYVRLSVACEGTLGEDGILMQASAAHVAQAHRFADQIGLTPAGLKENGWSVGSTVMEDESDEDAAGAEVVDMFRHIASDGG